MRRKSSKRYKKRRGNQYTTGKAVQLVVKHLLDTVEAAEEVNVNNLVDSPPAKETEQDDVSMTLNSTTLSNASFNKLKDFSVVSDELTFVTASSASCDKKQIDDGTTLTPTPSSSSNEPKSKLEHSRVQSITGTYQIIDLDILASTYSTMACPEYLNTSCLELKRVNKQGLVRFVNFFILFGHQRKLIRRGAMI